MIIAVLAAVAITGCGGSGAGSSLSGFKTGFASDKASFHQLGLDLQHAIATAQTKSDSALADEIGRLAARARAQAHSLADLSPPARFQPRVRQLQQAFMAVGADLSRISTAARRHDGASARSATLALIQDASRVKSGDTAISADLHLPTSG